MSHAQEINILKRKIEDRLSWGKGSDWSHQDFIDLGDKILEKTGINLSATTLKRLWGKVEYGSAPSTTTLNALANYLDFENWSAFKTNVESVEEPPSEKTAFRFPVRILAISISLLAIVSIVTLLSGKKSGSPDFNEQEIHFRSEVVASGVPNTVIFHYDVSKLNAEQFMIQQSWDSTRRQVIDRYGQATSSTYYVPGYFRSKLLANGIIVREHDLLIRSEGWVVTVDRDPIPRYLFPHEIEVNKGIRPVQTVRRELEDESADPQRLIYHYVDDFGDLNSDGFSLEVAVRNTYERGDAICRNTSVMILCTEGIYLIPMSIPGCTGDLRLRIGERLLTGKDTDLSGLGVLFEDFHLLEINVANRIARIKLDGRPVLDVSYEDQIGRVVGFRIYFTGHGEIGRVNLRDELGSLIYREDFQEDVTEIAAPRGVASPPKR